VKPYFTSFPDLCLFGVVVLFCVVASWHQHLKATWTRTNLRTNLNPLPHFQAEPSNDISFPSVPMHDDPSLSLAPSAPTTAPAARNNTFFSFIF
jgi:hypothetical protein